MKSSKSAKRLDIKTDKLNFNNQIDKNCKKPGQKLHALTRVTP